MLQNKKTYIYKDDPDRAIIGTESGAIVLADIESEILLCGEIPIHIYSSKM